MASSPSPLSQSAPHNSKGNCWKERLTFEQRAKILTVALVASLIFAGAIMWNIGAREFRPNLLIAGKIVTELTLIFGVIPIVVEGICKGIDWCSKA